MALALALLGGAATYRLTLGAPTLVRVAYAERAEAGASAPSAAGAVLTGSGYVVTGEKYISIGVRVPGRIDAYLVEESQSVTKGQALVQLDERDYEAALVTGARLARARASERGAGRDRGETAARAPRSERVLAGRARREGEPAARRRMRRYEQATAALREAEVILDYTCCARRRDGVILAKFKEVGEIAVPGGFAGSGDLIRMANLDRPARRGRRQRSRSRARQPRPSRGGDARRVPRSQYAAEVVKLYPQVNRQKGTLKVEVRMLEPDE